MQQKRAPHRKSRIQFTLPVLNDYFSRRAAALIFTAALQVKAVFAGCVVCFLRFLPIGNLRSIGQFEVGIAIRCALFQRLLIRFSMRFRSDRYLRSIVRLDADPRPLGPIEEIRGLF